MEPSNYIPILMMIFVLFIMNRNRKTVIAKKKVIERRRKGDKTEMKELAKKFIEKDCLILSFDSNHQFDGVIKEVSDGAILIEKAGKFEAINLDYVIKIKEFPRNKNGKKKTAFYEA